MKLSTVALVVAFVLAMEGFALAAINHRTAGPAGNSIQTGGGSLQTIIQKNFGAGTSTQISIGNTGSTQTSIQMNQ